MNTTTDAPIRRGELCSRLEQTTAAALASGALHPIDTERHCITDGGIQFIVHVARNLQRKAIEKARRDTGRRDYDPFLPPEAPLTVGAIGDGHIAVLNKYNVVENHLLIVTRRFEPQDAVLSLGDFEALCRCLRECDGLGFYNGGEVAGASQRHKHLQLIPPLAKAETHTVPLESRLRPAPGPVVQQLAALPFPHRIAGLPPQLFEATQQAATSCLHLYHQMLAELAMPPQARDGVAYQSAPYNLLLTRRWLMLVPRTREHFGDISINAMGFAGSLFVMDQKGLEEIRRAGPVAVLRAVSG